MQLHQPTSNCSADLKKQQLSCAPLLLMLNEGFPRRPSWRKEPLFSYFGEPSVSSFWADHSVHHSGLIWVLWVRREHLFSIDSIGSVKAEAVVCFSFRTDLLEFHDSWQQLLFLLAVVAALIFSHKCYQCFPFHQQCLLSFFLLISGGSLAVKYSAKGWAFILMNLGPRFFPVPPLSSHDPSSCLPTPSPIAKKPSPTQWLVYINR